MDPATHYAQDTQHSGASLISHPRTRMVDYLIYKMPGSLAHPEFFANTPKRILFYVSKVVSAHRFFGANLGSAQLPSPIKLGMVIPFSF